MKPIKITEMLKRLGSPEKKSNAEIARSAGITPQVLCNMKSDDREVYELKNGGYVVKTSRNIIFPSSGCELSEDLEKWVNDNQEDPAEFFCGVMDTDIVKEKLLEMQKEIEYLKTNINKV